MVSFRKIIFTYADRTDKIILFIGFFCAAVCGLGLPSFVFLFGNIADSMDPFDKNTNPHSALVTIEGVSEKLTLIGAGVWFMSCIWFACFIIASERIG